MTRWTLTLAAVALFAATATTQAQEEAPAPTLRGPVAAFVDANGDGINDNAPDHDGDGIVNHLDPDYQPAGTGRGQGARGVFVDENGDGINDNAPDHDGDGIPNGMDADYVRQANAQGMMGGQDRGKRLGARGAMGFVDANGDGVNDNALDSDSDGIINCQDEDYVRPETAVGQQAGSQSRGRGAGRGAERGASNR